MNEYTQLANKFIDNELYDYFQRKLGDELEDVSEDERMREFNKFEREVLRQLTENNE